MKQAIFVILIGLVIGGSMFLYQRSTSNTKITTPQNTAVPTTSIASGYAQAQEIPLTIIAPQENSTVDSQAVTITGKTTAGADVSINDTEITADASGNFSTQVQLDEGENVISIISSDQEGNYAEHEITVNVQTEE